MQTPPSARRGLVARRLPLAFAAVALLLAGLWWVLRPVGGTEVAENTARPDEGPVRESTTDLAGSEQGERDSLAQVSSEGGLQVTVGVRLGGDGRLAGRVLAREGGGVEGAKVELLPWPPAGSATLGRFLRLAGLGEEMADRVRPVATAISGSDGSFSFEGVRAGSYFVEARGAWHVPEAPVQARVAPSGSGGPVEVWVRRGGRVVGRVERPDGSPAAGAGVSLRPGALDLIERARSGDLCFLDTVADDQGVFILAGVPQGPAWSLAAYGPGFALSHAPEVAVVAGRDTEVVIRARSGVAIEGRIVAGAGPALSVEPGTPVGGAHVGVVPRGLRDLVFVDRLLKQCYDRSDGEGRFSVTHVPPGEVDLVAWAPGHLPSVGPSLIADEGGSLVAPDFALESGPTVEGRVVDGQGRPVAGVRVRWQPFDFRGFEFAFSFAPFLTQAVEGFVFPLTDAEGRFVAGAFPGEAPYQISLSKPGWAEAERQWNPSEEEGPIEIVLRRGGAIEGIVMDGARREPVHSFTVSSSNQIAPSSGWPGGDNPFAGGTLIEDPQGRFRLEPLEPGRARVTVSAPGYVPARSEEVEVLEGETVRGVILTLQPGGTLRGTVVDESGAVVPGAVVYWAEDAGWKRPEGRERARGRMPSASDMPAGLREFAAGLGILGESSSTSRSDGSFELVGVQPGQVVVYASHRDLATGQSEPVLVQAGSAVEGIEVELTQGAALFGTVTDRFGRQVEGVIVVAASPGAMDQGKNGGAGLVYQGYTDAAGRYEIACMAPGGYFLTTTRPDEALNPMSFLGSLNFELVTVPEGERVEYDLVDRSVGGARVSGLVTDRGEPFPGGNIVAFGFESESLLGMDVKLARIREDGSYLFESLAPGEYRFQVGSGGGPGGRRRGDVRLTVEIPDLPDVRLDIALPEGEISGVVIDAATGEPVRGAAVSLRALDAPQAGGMLGGMMGGEMARERRWVDDSGTFSFQRLEEGRYKLDVGPPNWGDNQGRWAPIAPVEIELSHNERLDDLEVRLEPALELTGLVRGEGGEPISSARIVALRADVESASRATAMSGEDGRFTLRGLAPGAWDLSGSVEGYAAASLHGVTVERGKSSEVELVLPLGIEVTVRVTDGAGRPVSGAAARLVALDGAPAGGAADAERLFGRIFSGEGTSGPDGRLALGRYAPGRYRLEVQRGLARAQPEEVELKGGGDVELRARLP